MVEAGTRWIRRRGLPLGLVLYWATRRTTVKPQMPQIAVILGQGPTRRRLLHGRKRRAVGTMRRHGPDAREGEGEGEGVAQLWKRILFTSHHGSEIYSYASSLIAAVGDPCAVHEATRRGDTRTTSDLTAAVWMAVDG